jgi:hypothetical protein
MHCTVFAFHHAQPWTNFDEGLRSFKVFPVWMHAGSEMGGVCTNNVLRVNADGPVMSVSEAFWMTDFAFIGSKYKVDQEKLEEYFKTEWRQTSVNPNWKTWLYERYKTNMIFNRHKWYQHKE